MPADLERDTRTLSDDSLGGRLAGTPGADLAQRYVVRALTAMRLLPGGPAGYEMPLVARRYAEGTELVVRGPGELRFTFPDDFVFDGLWPPVEPGTRRLGLAYLGHGLQNEYGRADFDALNLSGRAAAAFTGAPPAAAVPDSARLALARRGRVVGEREEREARARGAGAMFFFAPGSDSSWAASIQRARSAFSWSWRLSSPEQGRLPVAVLSPRAARAFLSGVGLDPEAEVARAGRGIQWLTPAEGPPAARVELTISTREINPSNVLAMVLGSERPDQAVVIVAHLDGQPPGNCVLLAADSLCNGAADNASGSAGLLAIARAFASLPAGLRPRRSVILLWATGEELGFLGSMAYALSPVVPMDRTVAAIGLDGMGVGPADSLWFPGLGRLSVADSVRALSRRYGFAPVEPPQNEPTLGLSDQFVFLVAGVPALFPTIDWFGPRVKDHHLHSARDEVDGCFDFEAMARHARLVFRLAYRLADAGEEPVLRDTTGIGAMPYSPLVKWYLRAGRQITAAAGRF